MNEDLVAALERYPDKCCEEVTRKGYLEPCDHPAVAARYDVAHEGEPSPVCSRHARGPMVPLALLLAVAS